MAVGWDRKVAHFCFGQPEWDKRVHSKRTENEREDHCWYSVLGSALCLILGEKAGSKHVEARRLEKHNELLLAGGKDYTGSNIRHVIIFYSLDRMIETNKQQP